MNMDWQSFTGVDLGLGLRFLYNVSLLDDFRREGGIGPV